MGRYVDAERRQLADLMADLGPQGSTILDGWTTRDLAAHLVLRERRPDAAAGIVVRALHRYSERVRTAIAARPYPRLVAQVRRPARWSPLRLPVIDEMANLLEFHIHHEDVRRAQPDWTPRDLPRPMQATLWKRIPMLSRLALRRFPAEVSIRAPGHGEHAAGAGAGAGASGEALRLTGDPGEIVLFLSGRQRVARVAVTGPAPLAQRLREAKLGV